MQTAAPEDVRSVIQLVESIRPFLQVLVTIPSALRVPAPVTSSAVRAVRFPPNRALRRF